VAAVWLSACGGSVTAPVDAAMPVDAGPWYPPDLPTLARGSVSPTDPMQLDPSSVMEADWSCVGMPRAPAGEVMSVGWETLDFQTRTAIPGMCVHWFPDGIVTDVDCTSTDPVSSGSGAFSLDMPFGALSTFELFPLVGPDAAQTYGRTLFYNIPANGTGAILSVSDSTYLLIPTLGGHGHTDGTGTLGLVLGDCQRRPVFGAVLRIADADGNYLVDSPLRSGFEVGYFNGSMRPYAAGRWTQGDGVAYAANVPVPADGRPLTFEGWGRLADGEEPTVIFCETGRMLPDSSTLFWGAGPQDDDPPACPGLRAAP
jgi:hypothetical protein